MNAVFRRLLIAGPAWFWFFLRMLVNVLSPVGSGKRLTVLIYHHILPDNINLLDEGAIDADAFNWQMRMVSKVFNVLTLDEALDLSRVNALPRRAVAITFDDGYRDNYTEAVPILNRYGLKATFFVVGNAVKEGNIWNQRLAQAILAFDCNQVDLSEIGLGVISLATEDDRIQANLQLNDRLKDLPPDLQKEKIDYILDKAKINKSGRAMLNEVEVANMVAEGMEIGCHTMSHPMLKVISLEQAEQDIQACNCYLSKVSGQKLLFFAYPYGKLGQHFTKEHAALVEKLGFKAAFTSDWGTMSDRSNPYLINRFTPWDKTPFRFLVRLALNFNRSD